MNKAEKIKNFDPSGIGANNGNLFGLPFDFEDSDIVIIPVPWEVTVSYLPGTAYGPQAILDYSPQIDLYDFDVKDAWKKGIHLLPIPENWLNENNRLRPLALAYIDFLENSTTHGLHRLHELHELPSKMQHIVAEINQACLDLKNWVKNQAIEAIQQRKLVGVLGGEHSSPLGLLEALSETLKTQNENFGILQIDAHADLRKAYEGFEFSHASIMYNALQLPNISKLVSVGVRDICEYEIQLTEQSNERIVPFYDHILKTALLNGTKNWDDWCKEIVAHLPEKVYISFDIDGLSPALCPNTGTPVPGGLSWEQAMHLLNEVIRQNKTIIGFDLCEVSVGSYPPQDTQAEFNANVGSRVLYKLCNLMGKSHEKYEQYNDENQTNS